MTRTNTASQIQQKKPHAQVPFLRPLRHSQLGTASRQKKRRLGLLSQYWTITLSMEVALYERGPRGKNWGEELRAFKGNGATQSIMRLGHQGMTVYHEWMPYHRLLL
jgi:hypothetical protein